MALEHITIKGAREHNLKNLNLTLPREKLVVITGLSGSGKSSLAFDTIYAEGQRRYVESLSAYARQFLQLMEKPDVDSIEGSLQPFQSNRRHQAKTLVPPLGQSQRFMTTCACFTPEWVKFPVMDAADKSLLKLYNILLIRFRLFLLAKR